MLTKVEGWPLVLPNDNGIRPVGKPDQCFYCASQVGQKHGPECCCVLQLVRYDVLEDGKKVGTLTQSEPYHWDFHDCEFARNESSWCQSNALDAIEWVDAATGERIEALDTDEHCLCGVLEFRYVETVDSGPFINLREVQS